MVHAGLALVCLLWSNSTSCAQQAFAPAAPKPAAVTPKLPPEFHLVSAAVESCFETQSDYRRGDLIHRAQVEQALDAVRETGWEVPEREAILKRTLGNNSFLVNELSSQSGRAFMRKIARYEGTYARLDRLSSISGGQASVRTLVKQKGGDEFVQYLATTKGGHNLGGMMSGAKQGVDLNKPTGRIYTVDDLLAELKNVYAKTFP